MNIFSNNYLSSKPIADAMREFAQQFRETNRVLDIGCGTMPYKKYFSCSYTGIDPLAAVNPDIVANAWEIPLKDQTYDGIILNQSLEHIANTNETIREIYRLLKPGGYVIVTVPHTMRNHSMATPSHRAPVHNFDENKEPYWRVDYYRFTKYGLMYLFRDFSVESISETTGYFGSLFQLSTYFFASLGMDKIWTPVYLINNISGLILDSLFNTLGSLPVPICKKFHHFTYTSLTINYICIFRKP